MNGVFKFQHLARACSDVGENHSPEGEENKCQEGGRRWTAGLQSKPRKWNRLRASERNTKEISQMTLGCSSNKNELTTCTINGTVSQESTGPLECTVKGSGSLKHHWTALELKQGSTSTLWVSWENASQFLLIILKLSQVNKQHKNKTWK